MIRFAPIPEPLEVGVDENAIVDWLIDALPGDRIVYFRGFLGLDRCKTGRIEDAARRRQLVAVANRIMAAAEQGLVIPVQKRIGEEDALYIAVRTLSALRPRSRGCDASSGRGNQRTVAAGNEASANAVGPGLVRRTGSAINKRQVAVDRDAVLGTTNTPVVTEKLS